MNHKHETTASHMPILSEILDNFKISSILEFGTGLFSTKLFSLKSNNVISIEQGSKNWFNYIRKVFQGKVKVVLMEKLDYKHEMLNRKYDLVFVDGDIREKSATLGMKLSDIVVVHDTQHLWSNSIKISEGFIRIDFKKFPVKYDNIGVMMDMRPWTSIFTNRTDIVEYFKKINEVDLYKKYKFPYVYDKPIEDFPLKYE